MTLATQQKKLSRRLTNYFLMGTLISIPVGVTLVLFVWAFQLIDKPIADLVKEGTGYYIPGLGIFGLVVIVFIVGVVATNFLGQRLLSFAEKLFSKIPIVSGMYGTFRDLTQTVMAAREGALAGVVLLEYPRKGIFSVGFVTGASRGELQSATKQDVLNVFIPTTPFPTNGFYVMVPAKEVIHLKMTVEEGLKLVISGGMVMPHDHKPEGLVAEAFKHIKHREQEEKDS